MGLPIKNLKQIGPQTIIWPNGSHDDPMLHLLGGCWSIISGV
ncbi:hypothetical protein MAR_036252 [Mya arenaria]|uniref:Uncharacterized protein n=1 Tax=Mya arenaria TaxID=6604 RepID=A0ABY7EQT0_MYAAR|nr:hypothetical protein MAR_036252 [Mya arenaria]